MTTILNLIGLNVRERRIMKSQIIELFGLARTLARQKYIGKFVLEIDCRGCMAEDHRLLRVGEVIGIKRHCEIWKGNNRDSKRLFVECRTMQSREDFEEELFYVCIEDGAFQPARGAPNAFFWRH